MNLKNTYIFYESLCLFQSLDYIFTIHLTKLDKAGTSLEIKFKDFIPCVLMHFTLSHDFPQNQIWEFFVIKVFDLQDVNF